MSTAQLRVDPLRLDFGERGALAAFKWTVPLQNASRRPIEILSFQASCRCTQVEPSALVIPPGKTRPIELTLDLSPKDDQQLAAAARDFCVEIKPVFKGGWPRQEAGRRRCCGNGL